MRDGWKYKKMEECAEIQYGTRVVQKRDGGTIYPVYGGGGETFRMDSFNRENCLIVARFAMSKCCVRYVSGKFFLNDSGLSVKAGEGLCQEYLNHHILYLNDDIYNLGKGAAQRNLEVKAFKQLKIAIPPQSVQLEIVAELDQINDLIRLKKEQLKDYDDLAQSIFYEMFGDPVENEKGWERRRVADVCTKISDGPFGSNLKSEHYVDSGIRVIRLQNIGVGKFIDTDKAYITKEHYQTLLKYACKPGEIVVGTLGNPNLRACKIPNEISISIHKADCVHIVPNNKLANADYWVGLFNTPTFVKNKSNFVHGQTRGRISYGQIKEFQIPLPPLPLQQSFAARIAQIEQQKTEVQKTIADLETLLAYRMQYWFE